MKGFNLEEALAGRPVKLRNGKKALIYYRLPSIYEHCMSKTTPFSLVGMIFNDEEEIISTAELWMVDGKFSVLGDDQDLDIVGMWEDTIKVEDLPKPFKPEPRDRIYFVNGGYVMMQWFVPNDETHLSAVEMGNCFRTFEDARKWLYFMESMKED